MNKDFFVGNSGSNSYRFKIIDAHQATIAFVTPASGLASTFLTDSTLLYFLWTLTNDDRKKN